MGKVLSISLYLNLTPNTLGCYGLTHYLPAIPFGNRNVYFRGSFQFNKVTVFKKSPLWKPEI